MDKLRIGVARTKKIRRIPFLMAFALDASAATYGLSTSRPPFPLYRAPFQLNQDHFRCERHMKQSERCHFRREIDQLIRKTVQRNFSRA
jgi:hypothetical protein